MRLSSASGTRRSRREWAFAKVTGVAHTASGQTLLRVSNRVKVSGLAVAPQAVPDFRFHLALAQADRLGVPVAKTLQVQAGELRVKRRQYAEEQAMKLPVKILFPTVLCILPALFVVVLGPAALSIYDNLLKG